MNDKGVPFDVLLQKLNAARAARERERMSNNPVPPELPRPEHFPLEDFIRGTNPNKNDNRRRDMRHHDAMHYR
ncbi:hypothetical protein HT118_12495 [Escherichia coli]|nr:hypothetical protein [Escherichia coli]